MVYHNKSLIGFGVAASSLTFLGTVAPAQAVGLTPAQRAGLDLNSAAGYGIVHIAPDSEKLQMNTGPVSGGNAGFAMNDGSMLVGDGVELEFSGGNNGEITGTVFYDAATNATSNVPAEVGNLQNGGTGTPPTQLVADSVITDAKADVISVATYASGLSATQTFSNSMTGNSGLNVINVAGGDLQNEDFTLSGDAHDYWVFNVSGKFQTNGMMTLAGVLPSQILFNLTGMGTVLETSGDAALFGTFLTASGGDYQLISLDLEGSLINIDGSIAYISGTNQVGKPFDVNTVPAPEPFTILGVSTAIGFGTFFRRQTAIKKK